MTTLHLKDDEWFTEEDLNSTLEFEMTLNPEQGVKSLLEELE